MSAKPGVTLLSKPLLRPDEVAAVASISKSQVYALIKSGRLAAVKDFGPVRVWTKSVLKLLYGVETLPG